MATEIRETERKYEFEPGAVLPSLQDLPEVAAESALAEQKLTAQYFDTAGLRLIRGGVTLRRRRGGKDQGWHLKLPMSDGRLEIGGAVESPSGGRTPDSGTVSEPKDPPGIVRIEPFGRFPADRERRNPYQVPKCSGRVLSRTTDPSDTEPTKE
jgi:hypothetical protein